MDNGEVTYRVFTLEDQMQVVEITLDSGESVVAGSGITHWKDDHITIETRSPGSPVPSESADGMFGKFLGAGKQKLMRDSALMDHFINSGRGRQRVAFAAPYRREIRPIQISGSGDGLVCQKDAFLCAVPDIEVSPVAVKPLDLSVLKSGTHHLQRFRGEGLAFVHTGGKVVKRDLKKQRLRLDKRAIVGFTSGVKYADEREKGVRSLISGKKETFQAVLRGTGTIFLQSKPLIPKPEPPWLSRDIRNLVDLRKAADRFQHGKDLRGSIKNTAGKWSQQATSWLKDLWS